MFIARGYDRAGAASSQFALTGPREQAIAGHLEVHYAADLREIAAAEEGLAVLRAAVSAAESDIRGAAAAVAA